MFLEGSRDFDIIWGTVTAAISFAIGFPLLWWWLPKYRRSVFGPRIDPHLYLQMGYGLMCMAMTGTNALCRYIDHGYLEFVHPTFAFITLGLVLILVPLVYRTARTPRPA
jgi:hypothetical protein